MSIKCKQPSTIAISGRTGGGGGGGGVGGGLVQDLHNVLVSF